MTDAGEYIIIRTDASCEKTPAGDFDTLEASVFGRDTLTRCVEVVEDVILWYDKNSSNSGDRPVNLCATAMASAASASAGGGVTIYGPAIVTGKPNGAAAFTRRLFDESPSPLSSDFLARVHVFTRFAASEAAMRGVTLR